MADDAVAANDPRKASADAKQQADATKPPEAARRGLPGRRSDGGRDRRGADSPGRSPRGGDLLERIQRVRQNVAADMGIILPKVRIRDNMRLEQNQYRIKIADMPVAEGRCIPASSWPWTRA